MRFLRKYLQGFESLSFQDKHAVLNVWVSVALALAGIALTVVGIALSSSLQTQANEIALQQFRREQNERNATLLRDSVRAFGLNGSTAKD